MPNTMLCSVDVDTIWIRNDSCFQEPVLPHEERIHADCSLSGHIAGGKPTNAAEYKGRK